MTSLLSKCGPNGSITPADALGLAAKLLKDHMNIFINFEEEIETGVSSSDDRKPEIHNENLKPLRRGTRTLSAQL